MSAPSDRPAISVRVNAANDNLDGEMRGIVRSVDVEDHDRLIDRARIEVQDADNVCTDFGTEGMGVSIQMGWGDNRAVLFQGHVTKMQSAQTRTTPATTVITALDLSYRMHIVRRVPTPHLGKLSEIILRIAGHEDYARYFTALAKNIVLESDPEFKADNPLIQFNETDLQFLNRLASLYGARTFVEFNRLPDSTESKPQFYFLSEKHIMGMDRLATLRFCQGVSEVLEFRYDRNASDAQPRRTAVAVNPADGIPAEVLTPQTAQTGEIPPSAAAVQERIRHIEEQGRSAVAYRAASESARAAAAERDRQRHHYADQGLPSDPNLIAELTRQDPTRVLGLRGTGVAVGNVHLRAKSKIRIIGFSVWDEGDWYVHKVNHKFTQDRDKRNRSYRTSFEVSR